MTQGRGLIAVVELDARAQGHRRSSGCSPARSRRRRVGSQPRYPRTPRVGSAPMTQTVSANGAGSRQGRLERRGIRLRTAAAASARDRRRRPPSRARHRSSTSCTRNRAQVAQPGDVRGRRADEIVLAAAVAIAAEQDRGRRGAQEGNQRQLDLVALVVAVAALRGVPVGGDQSAEEDHRRVPPVSAPHWGYRGTLVGGVLPPPGQSPWFGCLQLPDFALDVPQPVAQVLVVLVQGAEQGLLLLRIVRHVPQVVVDLLDVRSGL